MCAKKIIFLCADDYGYNASVSSGIRDLIVKNRLSASSCMVNMPDFVEHAQNLKDLSSSCSTGLHFNLTEGSLISAPDKNVFNLKKLIFKTHTGQIDSVFIKKELHAQLDIFQQTFGHLPDFIDGHQHIHQLPVIRTVMLQVHKERLSSNCSYRGTFPIHSGGEFRFKSLIIATLGGWSFSRKLKKSGISHNTAFSGIYDFSSTTDYRKLFRIWLKAVVNGTLVMCHPGHSGDVLKDSIAHARFAEYSYFASEAFLEDCEEFKVILSST